MEKGKKMKMKIDREKMYRERKIKQLMY